VSELFQTERLPFTDFDGRLVGVIVAKATWVIGEDRALRLVDDPEPVLFVDRLVEGDDPSKSPVRFESDVAPIKKRTDFVVQGTAYAPGGKPVPQFDVEVAVGQHRRKLRVIGPRKAVWRKPAKETKRETVFTPPLFTDPGKVARVELTWQNAYGGIGRFASPDGEVLEIPCPVNPFGKGYCVQNSREALDGLELPLVEDPAAPLAPETFVRDLGAPDTLPLPAGLGFYGRGWYPRVAYVGVMPHEVDAVRKQMREQAAQLDPEKDAAAVAMLQDYDPPVMDPAFHQAAAPGMSFPFLSGDESVALHNMTPHGHLGFNLPGVVPLLRVDRGAGLAPVPVTLDTVVLDVEEMRLVETFRARFPLAGQEDADRLPSMPLRIETVPLLEYRRTVEAG